MLAETRNRAPHSYIPERNQDIAENPLSFMSPMLGVDEGLLRYRDRAIANAIDGSIGIVPTTPIAKKLAWDFRERNYLRTALEEQVRGQEKEVVETRRLVIDTRYVPFPTNRPDSYTLTPEIFFNATIDGRFGYGATVNTVRKLPEGASPAVVKTVHRLIVGMLVDGAELDTVVRVYDKAADITSGEVPGRVTPPDFVKSFREQTPRGGYLSYTAFRYTPVSSK